MANSDPPASNDPARRTATGGSSVPAMAAAAERLLGLLDGEALAAASQPFDDDAARRDWHYIPRPRPGLAFAAMSAPQQKAAYDLLATATSLAGFAAATTIIALEDVLDVMEQGSGPRRHRPQRWGRHRADYSTTVFGSPAEPVWGWRFEGHHVSVNATAVDGVATVAPAFLGANPARLVPGDSLPPVVAPLESADVLGALLAREAPGAVLDGHVPDDILTANAARLDDLPPEEGARVADMGAGAAATAARLVQFHLGVLADDEAAAWWSRVEPSLGDVRFAYLGDTGRRGRRYYRLQGPHLLVEYDNTQNDANHVHTVLRDPGNDFGDDALRDHLARHPH